MKLYKEILVDILQRKEVQVTFPDLEIDPAEIVERTCYRTLEQIKAVIHDDSLDDKECFMRIEEIVRAFEEIGSGGGYRHDFG